MITKQDVLDRIKLNLAQAEKDLRVRQTFLGQQRRELNANLKKSVNDLTTASEKLQRAKRRLSVLLNNRPEEHDLIEKQAAKVATLARSVKNSDFVTGYEINRAKGAVEDTQQALAKLREVQKYVEGLPYTEFSNSLSEKLGLSALFRYRG